MYFEYFLRSLLCPLACSVAIFSASFVQADTSKIPLEYIAETNEIRSSDLTAQWWQWVYGIPRAQNPILDITGVHCSIQQPNDIWFLANSQSPETVERSCEIPAGSSILFPIINNIVYTPPSVNQTCEAAKSIAEFEQNPNYVFTVSLDGATVEIDEKNLIGSSDCFDLLARVPRKSNPPSYHPSASDGYWVMFNPLPVGNHNLEFMAQYHDTTKNEFRTMVHVRYSLTILDQ